MNRLVTKLVHRLFIVVFPFEWPEIISLQNSSVLRSVLADFVQAFTNDRRKLPLAKISTTLLYCQSSETFADDPIDRGDNWMHFAIDHSVLLHLIQTKLKNQKYFQLKVTENSAYSLVLNRRRVFALFNSIFLRNRFLNIAR